MNCLHPACPLGTGAEDWESVLASPHVRATGDVRASLLRELDSVGQLGEVVEGFPVGDFSPALIRRLFAACPCLYAQVPLRVSAEAVVHLCEVTLGQVINSSNVCLAFEIQHPGKPESSYAFPPLVPGAGGGDIMEALCSATLVSAGVLRMTTQADGWPVWTSPSFVSLNSGKLQHLKMYGDFLIPCAPHNLFVSVKSEAARERLLLSGNRLESVGFGFFNDASEFWTPSRIRLFKRWGFAAIYMPTDTLTTLNERLRDNGLESAALNQNGRALYRDLEEFGHEMRSVAGRSTFDL